MIRVSFSLQNHLPTCPTPPFEERVTSCRSSLCIFALFIFFPSISLILSLSSHPLVAMPYPPHPHPFHSSSVHPSLSLGLASVGRFQSVCVLMTPLGADVMLSSCCSAASLPPSISFSLCLPSNVSYVLIYMPFCLLRHRCSTVNWRVSFYV